LIADIRSTGFFNNKSKNLIACCKALMERFDGKIPGKIEDLTSLPGVGRKTANVILNHIYHVPAIVVDTHVARISRHLGLSEETDPVKIEFELQTILPEDKWIAWNHQLIRHGRSICIARRPKCTKCRLRPLCPGPYEA
jgi:endonuclease-3